MGSRCSDASVLGCTSGEGREDQIRVEKGPSIHSKKPTVRDTPEEDSCETFTLLRSDVVGELLQEFLR